MAAGFWILFRNIWGNLYPVASTTFGFMERLVSALDQLLERLLVRAGQEPGHAGRKADFGDADADGHP